MINISSISNDLHFFNPLSSPTIRPTMETINVMSAKIDQDDDNRPFNNNNDNDNNNSSETEHLDKNWNVKKDDRDASHLLSRRCHVTAGKNQRGIR